jgi:hypothetical protein
VIVVPRTGTRRALARREWRPLISRLPAFASVLRDADVRVFKVTLAVALLLITARVLAPFEVGKDQALQLQAAQRLLEGQGLTTHYFGGPHPLDVSRARDAAYLTWWPPSFSLFMALLLSVGLPLFVALKTVYGLTTLLGWVGWGIVIARFMSRPIRIGSRRYHVPLLVAPLLPIFTTPSWKGTDIFLWAGIPYIILSLLASAKRRSPYVLVSAAGFLFGLLVSIRYASAFVGLVALLILFQVNHPSYKSLLKLACVFVLSSLVFIGPTVLYIQAFSRTHSPVPDLINPASTLQMAPESTAGILRRLPVISILVVGSPLIERFCYIVGSNGLNYLVGAACLVVIFSVPFVLRGRASTPGVQEDLALSFSFLPAALVIFLLAVRLMSPGDFFGINRYYEPFSLCLVLICYEIVTKRPARLAVKAISGALVLAFAFYICMYLPASIFVPRERDSVVADVLSYTPARSNIGFASTSHDLRYPSDRIYTLKESSRLKVRELSRAHPGAIFFLANYSLYMYGSERFLETGLDFDLDFRRLPPPRFWHRAYTSEPIKVFWVLGLEASAGFVPESNRRLVYYDPVEKTRIFESDVPAGYTFSSKNGSHN